MLRFFFKLKALPEELVCNWYDEFKFEKVGDDLLEET
jgi:hypothetical protein